ncbi:hypothetical protein DLM_2208 [Aquitalea magnusonii]|uniref:Uncharacterized protein n=1 Tax=Aquitalea magnusonii TaxID=332411 RepID=A0A3G9GG59_9NEIS|nr:hypothetical protein DLM_2208 [Aquitalea magnusonii]
MAWGCAAYSQAASRISTPLNHGGEALTIAVYGRVLNTENI